MGIPFYFATLLKSHAGIVSALRKDSRMEVDVFMIDFNCLIHRYLHDDNPIQSVLDALETVLNTVCCGKQIFLAMDGVVPYAKIVQQRYRRFRIKEGDSTFDRNQISPGTPYMKELEEGIRARFPSIVLSSTSEPGEGEHKMFSWVAKLPESQRRSICVYGLDADLILLALARCNLSRQHSMWLLRESGEFNDPKLKHAEFATLSVWKLKTLLPLPIEQYLPLCVLCFGNDFMPNLAMFSLREDGYDRALHIYSTSGSPDLRTPEGRRQFLSASAEAEWNVLQERARLRKQPLEKTVVGKDVSLCPLRYALHILDGVVDMGPVVEAFWNTFHWTLEYFEQNTTNNWNWVYPYPDAPLVHTLLEYSEVCTLKDTPCTFGYKEQLACILPSKSLRLAKRRVLFADELHAETRHPWMKRFEWEMKPRISIPWNPDNTFTRVTKLI